MAASPLFVVEDELELITLWRLVAEAKFAEDPDDKDLWGSPCVNDISSRLGDAMREAARRSSRPGDLERHDQWVSSLRENIVLAVVKRRLREDAMSTWWNGLSDGDKHAYVRGCVAPFQPDDKLVEEFIRDAET